MAIDQFNAGSGPTCRPSRGELEEPAKIGTALVTRNRTLESSEIVANSGDGGENEKMAGVLTRGFAKIRVGASRIPAFVSLRLSRAIRLHKRAYTCTMYIYVRVYRYRALQQRAAFLREPLSLFTPAACGRGKRRGRDFTPARHSCPGARALPDVYDDRSLGSRKRL